MAVGAREGSLLERDAELERIEAGLAAAHTGRGSLLVITGAPGTGKTRLLEAFARRARECGFAVLHARAGELEADLPYGVVRALFERRLADGSAEDRERLLAGAAGLARPVVEPAVGAVAGEEGAVLHGLYWLVAALASGGPLALCVDDAHWADPLSRRFLVHLARRLDGLPAALAIAARAVQGDVADSLPQRLAQEAGAQLLQPPPLSEDAVRALLAGALGDISRDDLVGVCYELTGGNPLLVTELIRELVRRAASGDALDPSIVRELTPGSVARTVALRLDGLPPAASELARAVAVLGDGCSLSESAAVAGIELQDAARALDGLVVSGLLADVSPLAYAHPLLRSAVLDVLPVAARRAWHARAASVLAEGGAPPARIAVHLAAGEPVGEEWALHALRASARAARAQGAAGAAADLLACALREPVSEADRASVLAELGRMEVAAGRPEGFERLRAVGQLADDPEAAGRIALDLADGLAHATRYAEALEVVDSALGEPAGLSSELELHLEAVRGIAVRYRGPSDGDRERVVRRAGLVTGATPAERLLRATAAMVGPAERASDAVLAADLVREAWPEGLLPADTLSGGMTALVHADELEGARSWLDEVLADLRRRGRIADLARLLTLRGWVMCERGDLRASETDLREAFDLGLALFPGPPAAHLAVTLALSGRVDEAQAVLTGAALEQPALPENMLFNVVLYARGVVRAAAGRRDEAIDDLLELGSRHGRWELSRPVPPWRSAAAELLAAAGETTDAGRLAREELELAQRWGTARARGIALRTLAFLETGSDAIDLLESSVAELERSQGRLELARSLVELGAALRRSRRRVDARDPLRRGMDLAHAGGASPLAERARIELAATGARPRRLALTGLDALTPSERRVAELVATGMTNRETAQALFVTLPTVETHLRHVFQKLDLSSRTELAEALEDPRSPA